MLKYFLIVFVSHSDFPCFASIKLFDQIDFTFFLSTLMYSNMFNVTMIFIFRN